MKRSQKNAISYAIRHREYLKQLEVLNKYNLQEDFKKSNYKNVTWFLKKKYQEGVLKNINEVYGR